MQRCMAFLRRARGRGEAPPPVDDGSDKSSDSGAQEAGEGRQRARSSQRLANGGGPWTGGGPADGAAPLLGRESAGTDG